MMRLLWVVTIAVVLFATVSHANRAQCNAPQRRRTHGGTLGNGRRQTASSTLPQSSRLIGESLASSDAL